MRIGILFSSLLVLLGAIVGIGLIFVVSDDTYWSNTLPAERRKPSGKTVDAIPEGSRLTFSNSWQSREKIVKGPGNEMTFGSLQQGIAGGQDFYRRRSGGSRRSTPDRSQYTTWEIENQFKDDVFTFVRVQYDSFGGYRRGRQWDNDYPDCDWNFSVRLHELTSMQVDPNGKVLRLTDDELFDYPFLFFSNINQMDLSEAEVTALRKYLLKGGFMMADDFWAPQSWEHVYREMKRVFPELEPRELTREHEIFHLVYDVKGLPQVPSIHAWNRGYTFEYWHGDPQGDEGPHFWGFFDSNDRLMVLLCHNNDIGDGWEREGENKEYFTTYSERVSYPLGINIVTYAMTH